MEQKQPYLRIAAVVSSVLLVGAFVSYRAGAFERFTKSEPQPAPQATPEGQPVSEADFQAQMFMYSSKSAPAFTPEPVPVFVLFDPNAPPASPPPPPAAEKPPTFMGGSKSITLPGTTTGLIPAGTSPPSGAPPAAPNTPKP